MGSVSYPPPRITSMGAEARTLRGTDVQALDNSVAMMAAASAETLRLVADLDDEQSWRADGATSMSAWLAARYRITKGTAREWVRVAHALRDLPAIAAAYARGGLSWDQIRFLTRFATPETDEWWAEKARDLSPADLWVEARRRARVSARQAEDAHRSRYLSMWWDPEKPLLYLDGMLPGEQGAAVEAALSRKAEALPADPVANSPGQARLADALTELVTGSGPGSSPTTIVVHADAAALSGQESADGPALVETENGQRLAEETVRRLACDGRVDLLFEDNGRPVGIGRRGRTVPEHIARVLRHRDRGCRFPGCEGRRWVHAHHLVHWADGGTTDIDNLVLSCGTHHRLIHEGGWKTKGQAGHDLRFYDPRGRPVRTRPPELPLESRNRLVTMRN